MEISQKELDALLIKAYHLGWHDSTSEIHRDDCEIATATFQPITDAIPKELMELLRRVMIPDKIEEWVRTPNTAYENKRPLDIWFSLDRERLRMAVCRIEYGILT